MKRNLVLFVVMAIGIAVLLFGKYNTEYGGVLVGVLAVVTVAVAALINRKKR